MTWAPLAPMSDVNAGHMMGPRSLIAVVPLLNVVATGFPTRKVRRSTAVVAALAGAQAAIGSKRSGCPWMINLSQNRWSTCIVTCAVTAPVGLGWTPRAARSSPPLAPALSGFTQLMYEVASLKPTKNFTVCGIASNFALFGYVPALGLPTKFAVPRYSLLQPFWNMRS